MPYNEINIDGNKVEGHKYAGGGYTVYTAESFIKQSTPFSATMNYDGILHVTYNKTWSGYTLFIAINGVNSCICYQGSSITNVTGESFLPVKKGDVITIATDSPTNTWRVRVDELLYRS